jgi:hypothetical protein
MRISIRERVLLVSACILAGSAGWAQQKPSPAELAVNHAVSADVAATFAVERSQVAPDQCCFWFKGGGADAALTFWKGIGIAASLTGDHSSNITSGVDANKITYLFGPRYTATVWRNNTDAANQRHLQAFGQGLFGRAHGFNGVYPVTGVATASANSFALQVGGGLNLYLSRRFGLRLLEADYVRTLLPNAAADAQNDLRLSFGVTLHLGSVRAR